MNVSRTVTATVLGLGLAIGGWLYHHEQQRPRIPVLTSSGAPLISVFDGLSGNERAFNNVMRQVTGSCPASNPSRADTVATLGNLESPFRQASYVRDGRLAPVFQQACTYQT